MRGVRSQRQIMAGIVHLRRAFERGRDNAKLAPPLALPLLLIYSDAYTTTYQ